MGLDSPRVGALVIRAWLESEDPSTFRARVIHKVDVTSDEEVVTAVATPQDVQQRVQEWLNALLRPF